jgi:hypothetical protein
MRQTLVATALALAVFSGVGNGASAAELVIDAFAEASIVQQVATALRQLTELQQQYSELVATYQQVTNQYAMLTRFANPNGAATELEAPFLRNPLPSPSTMPGYMTGSMAATTTPFTEQYLTANQPAPPSTNYPGGQLMSIQENALALVEGLATNNLNSLSQRIAGLTDLQDQLNNATTIQQVDSANARIASEDTYLAAQQAQATNMQTLATTEIAAQEQARQQIFSQDAAETAAAYPAAGQ